MLTCRFCGSYRHLQRFCPHNWNNKEKKSNREDEDVKITRGNRSSEEIVLLSGCVDSCYFVKEAVNSAVLDTACTSTVAGENWFETYVASLNDEDRGDIKRTHSSKVFKFGGGERLQSLGSYTIPAVIAGKSVKINTDVVHSDIPLLLSLDTMKRAKIKMDVENDVAEVFGVPVLLNYTSSGHYCIPLEKKSDVLVTDVFAVRLDDLEFE